MISPEELVRLKDPKLYLESFCKIKGKTPGLIPLRLTEAQKDIFNALRFNNRAIFLKARQIGFSTATAGFLYHKTITTPGTNTALVAHKSDVAADFLERIKLFHRSTPEALRPKIHFNSKYEMSFPAIDSRILVTAGDNAGRGLTLHNVLASELAMWEKPDEMMASLLNAVPVDGHFIIESTPKGVGNLFHRMWMADNGFEKREYGWWWHYSQAEIDVIRKGLDPMTFAQEYELEFLASGRQVFNPLILKRLRSEILNVGDVVTLEGGAKHIVKEMPDGLRVYKPPVPGRMYVIGADVSEGVLGGDFSVATIFDRSTGEEVGFWRGHLPADTFGKRLNDWGRYYNNAMMVVEINNHGLTTITALKNLLYPQLYFRPSKFDTMGTQWGDRLGWKTTRVTRPIMIDDVNDSLREGSLKLHSKETMDEMVTFVFDDVGNMVCQPGYHDDCIFSMAIAFQGFKVLYDKPLDQINYGSHLPAMGGY